MQEVVPPLRALVEGLALGDLVLVVRERQVHAARMDVQLSSLVAQIVKNLLAIWESQVQSLGQEDLLESMATYSSILTWKIPWTEEPGGLLGPSQ